MVHFEVRWEIIFPRHRSATGCWTGKGNIGGGIVRFGNTCGLIGEATVSWTCCLPAIHLKVGCRAFEYENALRERPKAELPYSVLPSTLAQGRPITTQKNGE
jgi:hypothetical protein